MSPLPLSFEFLYWGIFASNVLLGLTLLQGWIYFHNNEDKPPLRLFVALLIILDIATAVLATGIGDSLWIADFGEDILQLPLSWVVPAEASCSVLIPALVQLFFASRVYLLHPRNWIGPGIIVLLTATSFVFGLSFSIYGGKHPYLSNFSDHEVKVDVAVHFVLGFVGDAVTTFFLIRKLRISQSTISKRTKHILRRLINVIVTRGLLVTALALLTVIAYFYKPGDLYWTPMHFSWSRSYVITMLAMLNGRKERRMNDVESDFKVQDNVSLNFGSFSSGTGTQVPTNSRIEISTTVNVESFDG